MNKIAITTGDLFGIGEEIVTKALKQLDLPKEQVIIIGKNIGLNYPTIEIDDSDNGKFCYESLLKASDLAKRGVIKGLATAPVSKEALHLSGYKFSGQTEILEKFLSKNDTERAEMLFIARDLRVMLLTRHLPLKNVAASINEKMIVEKTLRLNSFLIEKCKIQSPKIAFCALNPHCGEGGILGNEEIEIINPSILKLQKMGVDVVGTFSADGLFAGIGKKYLNHQKQEFDAIISTYHDQALTAIKAIAFDEVINTTIGLDIIRTSPSSGTAYDIAGKNIANPDSMVASIKLAIELSSL